MIGAAFVWGGKRQCIHVRRCERDFENPAVAQQHSMQELRAATRCEIDLIVEPVSVELGESPALHWRILTDSIPQRVDERDDLAVLVERQDRGWRLRRLLAAQ